MRTFRWRLICLNKLEAHLVLLSITLCWGAQYIFYQAIPQSVSVFAFMALTSGLGFLVLCLVFWGELKNLTFPAFVKGLVLSLLSTVSSTLLILGSQTLSASTAAFTGTLFVVFVPILLLIFYGERMPKEYWLVMFFVVTGLVVATDFKPSEGLQLGVAMILVGDVFFAVYIIILARYAKTSAPGHLAITRMLFAAVISFLIWAAVQPETLLSLDSTPEFWSSVLVIGLFVCGYATVMQIYAQRYTSPLSATLIFSTEIVFTMLFSILLPKLLGTDAVFPGVRELLGCAMLVFGVVLSNLNLPDDLPARFLATFKKTEALLAFIAGTVLYVAANLFFRPVFSAFPAAGPCAILTLMMGLFFGVPGAASVVLGNLLADSLAGALSVLTLFACVANALAAGGVYFLWYLGGQSLRPGIKRISSLLRITGCCLAASTLAALVATAGQAFLGLEGSFFPILVLYCFWGIFFGLPVGSLLTSVFGVVSIAPERVAELPDKTLFSQTIPNRIEAIGPLCEQLSEHCDRELVSLSRSYSVVLAVEEMLVNIVEYAYPEHERHSIEVSVKVQETITIHISHDGDSFNPVNFRKKERRPFAWRDLLRIIGSERAVDDLDHLGTLMVTQMAIKVRHKRKSGLNVLTIII